VPETHPLLSDAWLEFNRQQWDCTPQRITLQLPGQALPRLDGVLYLNRAGRVFQPPMNPGLPLELQPSGAKPGQSAKDWLELGPLLAVELRRRGIHSSIGLPASFNDARPLTWTGLRCGVRYTFLIPFPFALTQTSESQVRKRLRKAEREGFRCTAQASLADVLACVEGSEQRQRFSYRIGRAPVAALQAALGPRAFRTYVTYAPDGRPASARVALFQPGGTALDWLAGTGGFAVSSGATQLTILRMLEDLQSAGAAAFDFNGADIERVAAAKANWGGQLTPLITVEQLNLRNLVRDAWRIVRPRRKDGP
jgi:hypothetical protein